jgi:hypothetical protein
MSEQDFLGRWSRRKRDARAGPEPDQPVRPPDTLQAGPAVATERSIAEPEIDLSTLPPIDSITAASDVAAFLRNGIPQELTRAALRRAWSADPAIRDFVGLAENAWDFNDPNAIPGFGPLDCSPEQLQTLVDRVIGNARSIAENLAEAQAGQGIDLQSDDIGRAPESPLQAVLAHGPPDEISTSEPQHPPAALHSEVSRNVVSNEVPMARRTHGSALPR